MNQNNKSISKEDKIKLAKEIFAKFKAKINALLARENGAFENIMERINRRKIKDKRLQLDRLYESQDEKNKNN